MSEDKKKNQEVLNSLVADPEQEKKVAVKLFGEKLKDFFAVYSEEAIEVLDAYNSVLILLILDEPKFKQDLEKALYHNEEKLTEKKFILDGKPQRPTIANWLKHFIKVVGSGNFTNVEMSKYLISAQNVLRLDEEEKKMVRKLFLTYRNLKFFAENFKGMPMEAWEIISIEEEELSDDAGKKARTVLGPPKTEEEKNMENLKNLEEDYPEEGLERLLLEEEIQKNKQIEELKYEMKKYPEDSLERKALEDEINKMKK